MGRESWDQHSTSAITTFPWRIPRSPHDLSLYSAKNSRIKNLSANGAKSTLSHDLQQSQASLKEFGIKGDVLRIAGAQCL
jgi:hypothetical protein